MKKTAVIFDFDGTVISSSRMIFHCIAIIVGEYLGRKVDIEEAREKYSPDLKIGLGNYGIELTTELALNFQNRFAQVATDDLGFYELFPEIQDLLDKLKAKGHDLYVWTGRERYSTKAIIQNLDLYRYFQDIRCADDTRSKPDPEGLEELLVDHEKQNCVVIGDSFTDIIGAHAFGAHSIAALWCEEVRKEEVLSYNPHFTVEKPSQSFNIIQNILS